MPEAFFLGFGFSLFFGGFIWIFCVRSKIFWTKHVHFSVLVTWLQHFLPLARLPITSPLASYGSNRLICALTRNSPVTEASWFLYYIYKLYKLNIYLYINKLLLLFLSNIMFSKKYCFRKLVFEGNLFLKTIFLWKQFDLYIFFVFFENFFENMLFFKQHQVFEENIVFKGILFSKITFSSKAILFIILLFSSKTWYSCF